MGGFVFCAAKVYSDLTVAGLGLGTVFFGLICIIFICKIFGLICAPRKKAPQVEDVQTVNSNALTDEEKGPILAAVSAVIAEELGADVSSIKIKSFKRI
ncbi:MAG: OadG family protein [Clostridia bacterium]|nr:OadG family protein [Clostridia bacterium]